VSLWTPAEITTALWLDAADSGTITLVSGAVSEWRDKSGNARHASQATAGARPTIQAAAQNGLDFIRFTTDHQLNLAHVPQVTKQSVFLFGDTSSVGTGDRIFLDRSSAGVSNMGAYFGRSGRDRRPDLFWNNAATASWPVAVQRKAIWRWNYETGSPATTRMQVDAGTPVVATVTASELTNWDKINSNTVQQSAFDAYEIIIVNDATQDEIDLVHGYGAHKWGLASLLPADHPYKDAAPMLPDPTSPTSTSTGTGTATGSTGPAARLTPLNLFLVSIRLPDEPVEDPEPEPAEPGIVPVDIGEFWAEQGGWLGAYISLTQDGVPTHALILSDKAAEITSFWGNGGTYPSTIDGPGNFATALSDGRTYATAVQAAFNDAEHGGFDDWYVGALDEMYALYYNLKPTTAQNNQSAASDHPYYVPFRTGTNTGLDPLRTSIPEFQDGGSQFFEHDLTAYWSSTASVSTTLACQITFNAGFSNCNSSRTQAFRLRPIRRAPVTWTVP
jgi:hypothetical protein